MKFCVSKILRVNRRVSGFCVLNFFTGGSFFDFSLIFQPRVFYLVRVKNLYNILSFPLLPFYLKMSARISLKTFSGYLSEERFL